jgi:hypothetical protein
LLSTWTVKQTNSGGMAGNGLTGHTARVLVKQNDGTWKTKVHMFVPLQPSPSQEAKK